MVSIATPREIVNDCLHPVASNIVLDNRGNFSATKGHVAHIVFSAMTALFGVFTFYQVVKFKVLSTILLGTFTMLSYDLAKLSDKLANCLELDQKNDGLLNTIKKLASAAQNVLNIASEKTPDYARYTYFLNHFVEFEVVKSLTRSIQKI